MAETPEEVARDVLLEADASAAQVLWLLPYLAPALRAQYVAGLEAAITVCRGNIINGQIRAGACIEAICALAEQAKEK